MKKALGATTVADRILLVALLVFSVSGVFLSRDAISHEADVIIEVDGRQAYSLALAENRSVSVPGRFGDTVVEIRDRRVHVQEAHCPNRICVRTGWISVGSIVCLPNRIVITVAPKKSPRDGIDAVSG